MPAPAQLGHSDLYQNIKAEAATGEWPWPLSVVQDYLEDLYEWVRDIGQSVIDGATAVIKGWVDGILTALGTIWTALGDAIGSVGSLLGEVAGQVFDALASAAETITGTIGGALEGLGSWIVDALTDLLGILSDALGAIWDGLVAAASAVWEWLRDNLLEPLWDALANFFNGVVGMITSVVETVFNALTSMITPGSPLEPEQALAMFGVVSAAVMGASIVVTAINVAHPFKTVVQEQTIAFVYKFLGFSELSTAFWGSVGTEVLDYPMRLWARLTFRARVPGHVDADEMLWHGRISDEEWWKLHTYEGWKDEYIRAHYASMWRNPAVREIGMIMDAVALEPDKVRKMLRELGYNPEDIPLLVAVLSRRPVVDELRALRSELIAETVGGHMTLPELEGALRALGHTPTELELLRQIVVVRMTRAQRTAAAKELQAFQAERVKALTEAYRRDLVDEGEYIEELLIAGVEPSKASQTLYLEEVRKLPKPRRTYELA